MGINIGDIVFTRDGRPVIVKGKDPKTGNVSIEPSLSEVAEASQNGIKNGLNESERAAWSAILSEVKDTDQRKEIDALHSKIETLKKENKDARVIRYLQSELQHKMMRARYQPENVAVDPATLIAY